MNNLKPIIPPNSKIFWQVYFYDLHLINLIDLSFLKISSVDSIDFFYGHLVINSIMYVIRDDQGTMSPTVEWNLYLVCKCIK
jgi:hypothetical protein